MGLMERVATLLRANVNELVERAERPERLLKQLVLDMENQLLQVKTQVALALADGHQLERAQAEHVRLAESWRERASLAVEKGRDDLAREALERLLSEERLAAQYGDQRAGQREEAAMLRSTYRRLEAKLAETRGRTELLLEEQRRARTAERGMAGARAGAGMEEERLERRVRGEIAASRGRAAAGQALLAGGAGVEEEFRSMEREAEVEAMLRALKGGRGLPERAGEAAAGDFEGAGGV